MGKISLRRIAKEYDLPIKFLKDLHKTGRLTFSGFPRKINQEDWDLYLKEIGGLDHRRENKEGNLLIFIERRKSWLLR